jgi:hypothetical protein
MLLASVGAEMTKRIQGTVLGPFKTVLHADQIEHTAAIIWLQSEEAACMAQLLAV